eukprot:TRINITY_DN1870_c0_g1_i1.p1 TRINITY_DN1870_c0_g1~~TRINITY_DN1870_c0_g1_i1.p1  ORF type:complete len:146 (+),score=22.30 TRINITY_DN1870_c0_g1_i1:27-464(+)
MPVTRVRVVKSNETEEMDDNYDDTIKYRATRELKMGLWILTAVVVCILMHFSHSLGELREEISELDSRLTAKLSSGLKDTKDKAAAKLVDPDRRIKDLEAKLAALQTDHEEALSKLENLPKLKTEIKGLTETVANLAKRKRDLGA